MSGNCNNYSKQNYYCTRQKHVHEFEGSTRFAEEGAARHNHRFAGVTGEAIYCKNTHVHKIITNTDFTNHYHKICICTGPAIYIGGGKHIHLVKGYTTFVDGHVHGFIFTTLIEAPTERGKC